MDLSFKWIGILDVRTDHSVCRGVEGRQTPDRYTSLMFLAYCCIGCTFVAVLPGWGAHRQTSGVSEGACTVQGGAGGGSTKVIRWDCQGAG